MDPWFSSGVFLFLDFFPVTNLLTLPNLRVPGSKPGFNPLFYGLHYIGQSLKKQPRQELNQLRDKTLTIQ